MFFVQEVANEIKRFLLIISNFTFLGIFILTQLYQNLIYLAIVIFLTTLTQRKYIALLGGHTHTQINTHTQYPHTVIILINPVVRFSLGNNVVPSRDHTI